MNTGFQKVVKGLLGYAYVRGGVCVFLRSKHSGAL